jgi:hypothetical protein
MHRRSLECGLEGHDGHVPEDQCSTFEACMELWRLSTDRTSGFLCEATVRVPSRANAIFRVTEKVSRYLQLLFEADGITCQAMSG